MSMYKGRQSNLQALFGTRSIKGLGSLSPGQYVGHIEGVTFTTLPAGPHTLTPEEAEACALLTPKDRVDLTIVPGPGCAICVTDAGKYVMADATTKAWLTAAHETLNEALQEGAAKKLKLAEPVVGKIMARGEILYERKQAPSTGESGD